MFDAQHSTFLNWSTCCALKIHSGTVLIRMLVFLLRRWFRLNFECSQWEIALDSWHWCTTALLCFVCVCVVCMPGVTFTTWCCWCWTHFYRYSLHEWVYVPRKFKNHYVSVVNFLSWKRNETNLYTIPSAYISCLLAYLLTSLPCR